MTARAHPAIVTGLYRLLHGGDYNPEQWLHRPDILAEDARLMREANVNQASVAIFAWAALEPEPDRYEFAWLDAVLDRLHAHGVGVMLATPTAARPRWLAEAHPEVMRTTRDGRRAPPGYGRHNPCWSSPVLRERATRLIDRLAARYANHPALLGWHLNNEYGGTADQGRCHCASCVAAFQGWLRQRYAGDLDRLNTAWWTRFWSHQYQAWEHIRPGDGSSEAVELNWRRFASRQIGEWCALELAAVRRHSAAPATTNLHGGLDQYDIGQLAGQLDVLSYDSYPDIDGSPADIDAIHDTAFTVSAVRAFGGGRPWLLLESCPSQPQWKPRLRQKRPGVHRLLSLGLVAEGSDGVCYFQWRAGMGGCEKLHGAVLMQDAPHDTRVFREVTALGAELTALAGVAGAAIPAPAAVVWDIECEWARQLNAGLRSLPFPQAVAKSWHRPFSEAGIGCDVVDATRDLAGYRLVIVPGVFLLRPGFAERVQAAARAGAQVVIDGLSAWLDEDMSCVAGGRPGPLRAALGLRCEALDQLRDDERVTVVDPQRWLGAEAQAIGWVDQIHAEDCEVLATLSGGFHAGWPLLTRRACGAGALWYLAGGLSVAARAHLVARLSAIAGVRPCLPGLPAGVIARERVQPDRRYVFLLNPTSEEQTVPLVAGWRDAVTGAVMTEVVLEPAGARVVESAGLGPVE